MIDISFLENLRRDAYVEAAENYLSSSNVIGTFGENLPLDILYAYGLLPVPCEGTDSAIFKFGDMENVCDVIKSSVIYLKTDKCPILFSCNMYLIENTCTHFFNKLKENTDKKVILYKDKSELEKNIQEVYGKKFNDLKYRKAKEILDYIKTVLKKIDEYSDISAEEAFLLRYYTPYILDLERRKKYFDDICSSIKFKSEKNIIQKIIALCPRGAYKTILKEVKKEAYINPKENRVIRLCRGWNNADYGYKYCPYKYNMNVMYQED